MNREDLIVAAESLQLQDLAPALIAPSYDELLNALALRINHMINHDFSGLIQVLYRMDVPEKKLKDMLAVTAGADAPVRIAELIINRELKRIETKRMFPKNFDIPEDEKW